MRWNANSLSARMLHLLHQFVPDLDSVTLFLPTPSNTSYSLSGIGRFDKIWVQMNVVPRSTGNTNSGTRELTLKCK